MAKKKEANRVLITLKGCLLHGRCGEVVKQERFRFATINVVEVDGGLYRVNERFCRPVEEKANTPKMKGGRKK